MVKVSFLETCLKEGFIFTEREIEVLKQLDLDKFKVLSEELDKSLRRGGIRL